MGRDWQLMGSTRVLGEADRYLYLQEAPRARGRRVVEICDDKCKC